MIFSMLRPSTTVIKNKDLAYIFGLYPTYIIQNLFYENFILPSL